MSLSDETREEPVRTDVTPWEPGHTGKGFLMSDGTVHHWQTNEHGEPHHTMVNRQLKQGDGYLNV